MGWKSRNEPFVRHPTPSSALTPNHFMDLSWDPPGHCGEIPLPQSRVLIDVPLTPLQTPELLLLDRGHRSLLSLRSLSLGAPVLSLLRDPQCSAGPDTSLPLPTVQFPAGSFFPGRWAVVSNQPEP